jgi:hypothetical protein
MTWVLVLLGTFVVLGSSRRTARIGIHFKAVLIIVAVVVYEAINLKLL